MTALLRLDCSPRGPAAHSWRMADELLAAVLERQPNTHVLHRNLGQEPPVVVDASFAQAMGQHSSADSARGVAALAQSERLIGELEATQALIIATPMHNYTTPAVLKAWLDQVVRVGRAFTITPAGKVGRLADRPTCLVVSSGGYYQGERARQPDFLSAYMLAILETIGIGNVRFLRLEGLTRGEEALAAAYDGARRELADCVAHLTAASQVRPSP